MNKPYETKWYLKRRNVFCFLTVNLFLGSLFLYFFWTPISGYIDYLMNNESDFCDSNWNATDHTYISSNWSQLIDLKADACQDFYAFSCGLQKPIKPKCNSTKTEAAQDIMKKMSIFGSHDAIQKCLNANGSTAIQKFQRFKDTYTKGNRNDLTIDELIEDIKSFGGCPAINQTQWNPNNFDLTYALQRLTNLTAEMQLFKWTFGHLKNSTFVLAIEPVARSKFSYKKESEDLLGTILELLNTNNNSNVNYTKVAHEIMSLYKSVVKVYENTKDADVKEFDEYGFEIPESISSKLDTILFSKLNQALPVISPHYFYENVHVFPKMKSYLLSNPQIYLEKKQLLLELNDFYSHLSKSKMSNFLCAHYLMHQLEYLDFTSLNEIHTKTVNELSKKIEKLKEKEELLNKLTFEFPQIVDHLFINHCLDADTYDRIRVMIEEIRLVALQAVERQTWMDSVSKDNLLHKLNQMEANILAVNLTRDVKKLDEFYQTLHLNSNDSAREMQRKVNVFFYRQSLELIFHNDYHELLEVQVLRASTTNAAYFTTFNSLSIYAGILFPPNYQANRLDALNYGAIGSTIGHEFSHGFHLNGRNYGSLGERTQLFTPQTTHNFVKRAQCFIDQYNQFEDKEVGYLLRKHGAIKLSLVQETDDIKLMMSPFLNGTRTLEENLADNTGVQMAYEAYKMHLNGQIEPPLAKFPQFTNDQAFFLSYGSLWCDKLSPFERLEFLLRDSHSPSKARVNMVMQNSEHFAKAFNCPIGSPMNPVKKCQIWE